MSMKNWVSLSRSYAEISSTLYLEFEQSADALRIVGISEKLFL